MLSPGEWTAVLGFLAQWVFSRDASGIPKQTTEGTIELPGVKLVVLLSNINFLSALIFLENTQIRLLMLWRRIYKSSFVKRNLLSGLSETDHHFFDPCRNRKRGPKILTHPPTAWPWATQHSPGQRASWHSSVFSLSLLLLILHTLSHCCNSTRPAGWPASSSGSPALMDESLPKHLLWAPVSPPCCEPTVSHLPLPVFSTWPTGMLRAKLSFSQHGSDCATVSMYFWQHSQLCVISNQMNNFRLCISMSLGNIQGSEVQLEIFPERWVK